MAGQNWWIIALWVVLLVPVIVVSDDPDDLSLNERFPDKDETEVCGRIRDVIERDSGRFRRILIRNTNDQVDYKDEDARRMTSRTKSKLDVLASLVRTEWSNDKVRVTRAWTDQVDAQDPASLHYEGRSVRLQTELLEPSKLARLAGLAIEAGFDWVEYTTADYIRASVIPDVCQTSVDLVFVLDNSGSVGDTNFNKVKDFVKRVIDFFNIGVDGTHVSVVTYDTDTHIEFNLVKYYTKNELRNAVDNIQYRGFLTYTGEALNTVRQKVLTAKAGMRTDDGIPKVLLLLTDGYSNGINPLNPASAVRNLGVNIFSIGVGKSVSSSELNGIASDPDKDYVFRLDNFNELADFVDRVSSVSCSEGSLIDSCEVAETTVESGSFKYFRTTFDVITKDEVSIEVRDTVGVSHLYASAKSRNPGPLDADSVSNEADTSPRAVSLKLDDDTKTVYVAVQGQMDHNKFNLSFWDNLFEKSGIFEVNVTEEQSAHEIITLNTVSHPYELEYFISAGDRSAFSITKSGTHPRLSTRGKLDYETTPQYSIVVEGQDKANKCHKSRAMVQVNVIDENDNFPTFKTKGYTARVPENAQRGAFVIKIEATDLDSGLNGKITYTIASSTAPGLFAVDSNGDVTLQGLLNFETENWYSLTIKAEDSGSPRLHSNAVLNISVIDINEQPSIGCDGSCVYTISEDAQPNTPIGGLLATDPDTAANCLLQYSMPSLAAEKFTVANNGRISTKAGLDRETIPQYLFYITVKDCGSPPLTDSVRVTIIVSDVNDNSPQFPGPYSVDMDESESSGSTVVQVKATDADEGRNAEIKYALTGSDASDFSIEDDGTIKTETKLDYEQKTQYSFTVVAKDQGSEENEGRTTVTVNVIDVNDNAPVFSGLPYVAVIKENAGTGTPVINVNATDSDSGLGGQLKYSIISGNTRSAFAIHPDTGMISVNSALDKETTPSYTLLVQAKDSGSPSLHSQVPVIITVQDTNDNIPIFQGLPYSASVPEDFGTSQPVITVYATDDDTGVLGRITYSTDSSTDASAFVIDNNGNIRVRTSLDYETKTHYSFKVIAKDGGNATAEAHVTVYVTDVNDHEPRFDQNPYVGYVDENLNTDHVVNTVRATDADSGELGSVTYSIIAGNIGNSFTINANGEVIALTPFDRESREVYNLTIRAKDGGSPAKSSTTQMDITIRDENDNTPSFDKTFYSFSLSENNQPNEEIGKFGPATDDDKGANAEIDYSILSGNIVGDLEYDGSTGMLKAKNVLDRERIPVYTLGIEARDRGTPSRSSTIVVQVSVLDKNDNAPVFTENPKNCEIDENSAMNSRVCSVSAMDSDDGINSVVTYELVTPSSTFSVDQDSGEIKALKTLDREDMSSYTFDIIAKDGGSPSKNATVTVNVKVLDKNDNEPQFDKPSYSFDVSEDADEKTVVGHVFAEDDDEGDNGKVVYSITAGNTGTAFSINDTSGVITVASDLDRENVNSYRLTVKAADRGTPSQFSSREVLITVTDVNDNDPIFTADPYRGNIAEDASVGSPVVQVEAKDADEGVNSQVKYSITGGEQKEHFSIDEDSGFINTATKLDFESKESYSLTVTATDGGVPQRSTTAQVEITVDNTNDNAPDFEPSSPVINVSEAIAVGTDVVQFNATDKDGNSLTFSITSGNIADTFRINETNGVLTTNAGLDRETIPTYKLRVTVKDSGGQSSSRNLTIIVTDENDNEPRFDPPSYSVNVTENSQAGAVVTVTATDKDEGVNAKITYSIDSISEGKFNIDPTSGEISTNITLDYEVSPRYEITVTAKDAGTPSLSSTAKVIVTVEDLNDNYPNFPGDYTTSLQENTAGTVIRVEANDPDSGVNGEIEYSITAGDDDGSFMIGADGVIKVVKSPDRETDPSFTLTISASNTVPAVSAPPAKTTATVTITIDDVNDNAPIITNRETSVEIEESSPTTTDVIDVHATDDDIGVNSELEYEIVAGNIDGVFVMNEVNGQVKVNGDIDREKHESYTLKVRVSDKGNPRLYSEKEFLVNVTDIDDSSPVFTAEPYEASVSEAANVSTFVIEVKATDDDVSVNGQIKFSIVSGDSQTHFRIDAGTGDIYTNALLDFESIPTYNLVVRAEDTAHTVETSVTIRLININDNSPIFNPSQYAEDIAENRRQGYEFRTLQATDKDDFGGLTYTIVSGNTDSKFTLEPGSGKLRVAGELDRETTDFYNLTVRVTDGGVPARSDTAFVEITITDINDNPPRFNTSREQRSVVENSPVGTLVLTVRAEDKDIGANGEVVYEIQNGNDAGLFELGESSGELTVNGNIDRETVTNFRLEIMAQDKGTTPMQSSILVVDIEVLDTNDNSPKFTEEIYTRRILESSSIGSFVEEVQAIDADIGVNAQVVYSLMSGTDYFKIENETGVISTIVTLDRESIPSFNIMVFAKDLGNPSQNSTALLNVTVLDANDNAPVFENMPLMANVTEEKPKGQFVIQLVAKDADEGANAIVEYELDSNAKQFLAIDSQRGNVSTTVSFDFEAQRNYSFKVTATDKGNPPLSTTATLHINVLDTDDNCPVFNPKEYNVTIEENRPLDDVIVTVYATDVDTVGKDVLEYGIRDGNKENTFRIGRYTGELTSWNKVDREFAREFNLIVRAGDDICGVNSTIDSDEIVDKRLSKSIANVNIFVTDQNDNAPKFHKDSYKHTLTDIYSNTLLWLNATDPDEGVNAEFDFGLHGVTREGSIRTLIVTATDKGVPTMTSNTTVEVSGENCEALKFSVSARGNVSVKTLCSFSTASMTGKDLVGEKITFSCNAIGNTVPEYRWTRDGVQVRDWSSSGVFELESLGKDNAGVYSCIASSEAGSIVSEAITIHAYEPAKISVSPKDTSVQTGRKATLSCRATGDDPITYEWYKDDVKQQSSSDIDYSKPDLVFAQILATDEGRYVCKVMNGHGSSTSSAAVLQVYAGSAVVELDINVNNPRVKENCQLFDISDVTDTLNGLIDGSVTVVEFEQPETMCNITACVSDPCQNQGKCLVRGSGFVCQCPRGWGGRFCEQDSNECEACVGEACVETCENNGTCVNRPGSFSCTCPNSGITGKLCQFDEKKDCEGKCQQGETCYPKETENQLGYECITNVRTVSMVYQLDSNQLPFEDWMIYDVAQNVENTIVNNGLNGASQEDQGTRKRRDAVTTADYGACSVRVTRHEVEGSTLDMAIILVCENSPDQTFVCNALLAEGTVQSCTGNDGQVLTKDTTTPTLAPIPVTVVFIARDENNKDTSATTVVDDLKTKGVYEKLEKNGMVVTDIKPRSTPATEAQGSDLSAGVIAAIIIAILLLFVVTVVIIFVVFRTRRKNRDRDFSIGGRAILAPSSRKQKNFKRRDISMKEIKDAEIRGMSNKMFSAADEQHQDSDVEDGTFMVQIPKAVSRTNLADAETDYMSELETASWFHGSISRSKAEDILARKESDGSYLVRAGLDKGEFYISTRTSEDGPKYRHVAVNRHDDCFVAICGPETQAMQFTTFNELLEYLRSTPTHVDGTDSELLLKDYIGKDGEKGKHNTPPFSFMTMAERSPTKTAMKKKAESLRDLDEAEVRGVFNTAYADETDGGDSEDLQGGGWFMLNNPEFTNHKVDFMGEIKNSPWYYGKISREKSQEILNNNVSTGTFIVRSGLKDTEFYISVRVADDDPKVRHIEVDRYQNDFVASLGDEAMAFPTFGKLLEYLRSNPIHFEGCEDEVLLTEYVDRLGITIL